MCEIAAPRVIVCQGVDSGRVTVSCAMMGPLVTISESLSLGFRSFKHFGVALQGGEAEEADETEELTRRDGQNW